MNIIKLNAIDSTNVYLKEKAINGNLNSYTIVVANHQTSGRGQRGTVWLSERGKNLTFSVLINFFNFKASNQFYLSMAVSLGLVKALAFFQKNTFCIKWPNDILAGKDKVAGILIENTIGGTFIKQSVIGIGLNVNQEKFDETLLNVTSLKNILGFEVATEELLLKVVTEIKYFVSYIENSNFGELKKQYLAQLYKFKTPTMFEDMEKRIFLGKIVDISDEGRLVVEIEGKKTGNYDLKEIKFADF